MKDLIELIIRSLLVIGGTIIYLIGLIRFIKTMNTICKVKPDFNIFENNPQMKWLIVIIIIGSLLVLFGIISYTIWLCNFIR